MCVCQFKNEVTDKLSTKSLFTMIAKKNIFVNDERSFVYTLQIDNENRTESPTP